MIITEPNHIYHQRPEISATAIRRAWGGRVAFERHRQQVQGYSPALHAGTALHGIVLEDLDVTDAIRPAQWTDWKSAAARQWRDEREAAGLLVLTDQQAKEAQEQADAVRRWHDAWTTAGHRPLLYGDGVIAEASIVRDGYRCRPDAHRVDSETVVVTSLKTARSFGAFRRSAVTQAGALVGGYDIAEALYEQLVSAEYEMPVSIHWLVVCKSTQQVRLIAFDGDARLRAHKLLHTAITRITEEPRIDLTAHALDVPPWADREDFASEVDE